jgi:hypothetical protein
MSVPPGWEERSQLIIVSPGGPDGDDQFRQNLVVIREHLTQGNFASYIGDHIESLDRTFDSMNLLSDGPKALASLYGHLIEYSFVALGRAYRQGQFFVLVQPYVYAFTYSDLADRFPQCRDTAHQCIGTAEIDGAGHAGDDLLT